NVYNGLKDKYNAKRDLFPLEPLDQEEQYAINKFIGSSGFKLNDAIRRDQLTANDKEFITNLDKGLDKMPNYQGEVIRTITNDRGDIQDILKDLDQEVPFKSYTSASIKERFHEDASIIMRINSKTGKNISLFNKGEQEVLFKRGLKYKVISKTKKENTYYFQLEEK
ncbi:MAG TPA: ADP-ribosyltransferase, partial [Spirochaetota bacterium]|nr:ADP-ribosyltransferase [Spirochaetota bacterium]